MSQPLWGNLLLLISTAIRIPFPNTELITSRKGVVSFCVLFALLLLHANLSPSLVETIPGKIIGFILWGTLIATVSVLDFQLYTKCSSKSGFSEV